MVQVIRDPYATKTQGLGASAGRGLSAGLENILNSKIEAMKRKPIAEELQQMGVHPRDAAYISRLPAKDQLTALERLRGGGEQQSSNQQQYSDMGQGPNQSQQQSPQGQGQQPYRSALIGSRERTPAQLKHDDSLVSSQQNLEDIVSTTDRMLKTLGTGKLSLGVLPGYKASLAPSWLDPESELFDKDSAHIVNLTSADLKGVPSQFRVRLIEKEKPGLRHSSSVNEQILKRLNSDARTKLGTLSRRYPQIGQLAQPGEQQEFGQQGPVEQQPEQGQQPGSSEAPLAKAARLGVRTASRAGEAVLGAPGDVGATVLGIGNWATNGVIPSYGQLQEVLPFLPPTSDDIKQFVGKATGGYTNPRGGLEETVDNVASTVASLFLPSKFKSLFAGNLAKVISPKAAERAANIVLPFSGVSIKKALGLAAAGEGASLAASALGAGPLGQAGAKLAAMTLASTGTPKQLLTSKMKEAYDASDKSVAGPLSIKNTIGINPTLTKINEFKSKVRRSASPNKDQILGITNEIEKGLKESRGLAAKKGFKVRASVADVVNQKKSLNEWYGLSTNQRVAGEQFLSPSARKYITELGNILEQPLAKYGETNHTFGANRALANDLYAGLANPLKVGGFIKGLGGSFTSSLQSYVVKALFKQGVASAADRLSAWNQLATKSPQAVQLYWDALKAAGEGNAAAFVKSAARLDKEALRVMGR